MLEMLQGIVFGLVQGLTEFLPVSSSGHLVLLRLLFNFDGDFILLSIFLHVATLLAVVCVFWKDVMRLVSNPFSKTGKKLILATVPTVIIALVFKGFLKDSFSGSLLPICFILTAGLLLLSDITHKAQKAKFRGESISFRSAFIMGTVQGLAILPGLSRSGTTISAGLLTGADKSEATSFSFLMSIPIIIASLLFEVIEILISGRPVSLIFLPTAVACLIAFFSGLFAIRFMLKIMQGPNYKYFSVYLIIIALACLFI